MTEQGAPATSAAGRRAAYARLRAERPHLFGNDPGTPIEILLDPDLQDQAAASSAQQQRDLGLPDEFGDVGVWYEDPYIKLVKDAVRFPSGRIGTYIRTFAAVDSGSVLVVPTTRDGRIALIRHYRHGCREWHWELPRGFAEPGVPGAENVAKEIREELGATATDVTLLARIDQETADKVGVYHCVVDLPDDAELSAESIEEGISEVRLVTARELESMILAGELTDMFTLSAYATAVAAGVITRG